MPTIQDSVNTKSFLLHNKNTVTFKEVQHLLESQPDHSSSQQSEMLQRVRGKPFWIWDKANHQEKDRTNKGDCCFTDIIGRCRKNGGNRKPFWDYQKILYSESISSLTRNYIPDKNIAAYQIQKTMPLRHGNEGVIILVITT